MVEIEQDTNTDINKEVLRSIIKIKKSIFNSYVEYAWHIYLDGPWSNIPLQVTQNSKENNNGQEFTQDNEES